MHESSKSLSMTPGIFASWFRLALGTVRMFAFDVQPILTISRYHASSKISRTDQTVPAGLQVLYMKTVMLH